MLELEEVLDQLGRSTAAGAADTLLLWRQGYIDRATLIDLSADVLDLATVQGTYYGQRAYAEWRATLLDTAPEYRLFIDPLEQSKTARPAFHKAVTTILDDSDDSDTVDMRLERLSYNTTVASVQESYQTALQGDSEATGWTRGLNLDACELCNHWYRGGQVWPKEHDMPKHNGCRCQQVPVYGQAPAQTQALRDKSHTMFLESLDPSEKEYYYWAKEVRDIYAQGARLNISRQGKRIDVAALPKAPRGWGLTMIPPPNPKLTLRGIQ